MMLIVLLTEDPINARKLAIGFVQSLRGISWLPLFRISFLPQERDVCEHSGIEYFLDSFQHHQYHLLSDP